MIFAANQDPGVGVSVVLIVIVVFGLIGFVRAIYWFKKEWQEPDRFDNFEEREDD